MSTEEKKLTDQDVSEIDKAIAAAMARKAAKAKAASAGEPLAETNGEEEKKSMKKERKKLSPEERAKRDEQRRAEREAKKAARAAAREAKMRERMASRKPAHMRKVEAAGAKLAPLSPEAQRFFDEATTNLSNASLALLALHIQHFNRVQSTLRASSVRLDVGQAVTITGGDPRYVGRTGKVVKAQRIRCYVALEGQSKPVYLFTSDVTPIAVDDAASDEPLQKAVGG
jgi:hypothetical protein